MRAHGLRHDVDGLGCHDHCCLVYEDSASFLARGTAYLEEGLRRGERVMYVQGAPVAQMRRQLAGLGPVDELVAAGRLVLLSLDEVYAGGGLDLERQGAFYHHAIDAALADGHCGLRALADGTAVLANATQADVDGLIRWEARADRIMAERPMTGICAYDGRAVPPAVLARLAAVHPLDCGGGALSPYHLFSRAGDGLALSGSLDTFTAAAFEQLLDLAGPGEEFVLDLSALQFVDHEGVLAIARRAAVAGGGADGPRMSISGAPRAFTRVAELIGVRI